MTSKHSGMIHALEFGCQAPLKFYEHCASCARLEDDCPDLDLGREVLRGKKRIVYDGEPLAEDSISATAFKCLAPLNYFEKSRKTCAHEGRCREEGLLLALLSGKKELVYAQKEAIKFPRITPRPEEAETREEMIQEAAG
ncbi:MAG: hypothetical protein ISR61_09780 [Desulfobacteraceae bacterium]|uniref:Uncharacterized protein n=1 Tax=Candidatus Desulfacyla euxinica TaxID=2841693 RepID=A0A8J6N368_9DELT|nr:hypothetical protein [Candidatus Desulfacyla euxinica]MBL6979229.1 hypothetical protein [Desulfobacteraceae bacterium]MBL7217853.1 hypothetical protein [Desulfobacteraceae bacterium]